MNPLQPKGTPRRHALLILWTVFVAGLLVQAAAPRLHIVHNAFAIPSTLTSGGSIHPAEIVARERIMQSLSALLTLSGALGLATYYFVRKRQESRALAHPGSV